VVPKSVITRRPSLGGDERGAKLDVRGGTRTGGERITRSLEGLFTFADHAVIGPRELRSDLRPQGGERRPPSTTGAEVRARTGAPDSAYSAMSRSLPS